MCRKDLQTILEDPDFEETLKRARYFATSLKRKYEHLDGIVEPEDVVQMAIKRILSGERHWDPNSQLDFIYYFFGVIKSIYSAETKKSYIRFVEVNDSNIKDLNIERHYLDDLDFLKSAYQHLKIKHPELAEFFITATNHAVNTEWNNGDIARAMGISLSTYCKRRDKILGIIAEWKEMDSRMRSIMIGDDNA